MTMNRRDALKIGGAVAASTVLPLKECTANLTPSRIKPYCKCLKTGRIYPDGYAHALLNKTGRLHLMEICTYKPFKTANGATFTNCNFLHPCNVITENGKSIIEFFNCHFFELDATHYICVSNKLLGGK